MSIGLPAERLWVTVYRKTTRPCAIWANEIGVPLDAHRAHR